jgi:hypothetical protein
MSLKFTTYFAVGRTPSALAKTLKVEADEGVVRGPGTAPHADFFNAL